MNNQASNMDSDSDSSKLSSAPPSPSPPVQSQAEVPINDPSPQIPTPPPAKQAGKKGNEKSAQLPPKAGSSSRRSSRVIESESRAHTPIGSTDEILAEQTKPEPKKIKIKLNVSPRKPDEPPTPIATTADLPENQDVVQERPEKGKKRKTPAGKASVDDDMREKMGSKKPRIARRESAPNAEPEKPVAPKKKGVAVKRRAGGKERSTLDDELMEMFGEDDSDADKEPEAGTSTVGSEVIAEQPVKKSEVASQKKTKTKTKAKRASDDYIDEEITVDEPDVPFAAVPERSSKSSAKKDKTKKSKPPVGELSSSETQNTTSDEIDAAPASKVKEESAGQAARKPKSFAQAVSGAPPPAPDSVPPPPDATIKKEKKPLSAIPKISKLSNSGPSTVSPSPLSQSQSQSGSGDKKPPIPGSSSSSSQPAIVKKPPLPTIKKQVHTPSLLESTMKNLLNGTASTSTPQKKEVSPPRSFPGTSRPLR